MDGYSVSEAASVLGVPIERVWELLARGVLAGAPEGETGMRVFLQPRAGAVPAPEPPRRTNGDDGGAEPERELSPFRELLTEFRNLTERYGQALLALGESRGEVASLRSRVDMLEARMDLRLPGGGPATWSSGPVPYAPDHAIVPTAPPRPIQPSSPVANIDEGTEEEHRSRARGPRRATESFAEALARADDPSAPELPPAESPGEWTPAAHEEPAFEAEAVLPRELPAADTVPVADEAQPDADEAQPDADALPEADEALPEADEAEPGHAPAAGQVEEAADGAPGTEPPAPEEGEAGLAAERARAVIAEAEPEPDSADEAAGAQPTDLDVQAPAPDAEALEEAAEPTAEDEEAQVPTSETEDLASVGETDAAMPERDVDRGDEPASDVVPAASAPPLEWDAERYTTTIDEPDWFEAEALDDLPAGDAQSPGVAPPVQSAAEPSAEPTAAEETVMWLGSERDEEHGLPGSDDLGEALRALDAVAPPAAGSEGPADEPADRAQPLPPSALRYRPVTPPGPTARAYRRLRRIFPS